MVGVVLLGGLGCGKGLACWDFLGNGLRLLGGVFFWIYLMGKEFSGQKSKADVVAVSSVP